MKYLFCLLFTVCFPLYSTPFIDPMSQLHLDIPSSFQLNEEDSQEQPEKDKCWWYEFSHTNQSVLTIEIDQEDPDQFVNNRLLQERPEEKEDIICDALEFKDLTIEGIEMTKCKILAHMDSNESLYICDYLFIQNECGFSISLMKKSDAPFNDAELDALILTILQSIRF